MELAVVKGEAAHDAASGFFLLRTAGAAGAGSGEKKTIVCSSCNPLLHAVCRQQHRPPPLLPSPPARRCSLDQAPGPPAKGKSALEPKPGETQTLLRSPLHSRIHGSAVECVYVPPAVRLRKAGASEDKSTNSGRRETHTTGHLPTVAVQAAEDDRMLDGEVAAAKGEGPGATANETAPEPSGGSAPPAGKGGKKRGQKKQAAPCAEAAGGAPAPGYALRWAPSHTALVTITEQNRPGLVRDVTACTEKQGDGLTEHGFTSYLRRFAYSTAPAAKELWLGAKARQAAWNAGQAVLLTERYCDDPEKLEEALAKMQSEEEGGVSPDAIVDELAALLALPSTRATFAAQAFSAFDPHETGFIQRADVSVPSDTRGCFALRASTLKRVFADHAGVYEVPFPGFCVWLAQDPDLLAAFVGVLVDLPRAAKKKGKKRR
ncbi:hypothetical protein DIPPA_25333 [Diplonema papillatum]|nr:hypothetical protein DIPPA_25333 [Diplonema papillatum]|eukprot:gene15194-23208_t